MQNWTKKEKGLKRIALLYICAGPSQVTAAPELHLGGLVQILMQQSIRASNSMIYAAVKQTSPAQVNCGHRQPLQCRQSI